MYTTFTSFYFGSVETAVSNSGSVLEFLLLSLVWVVVLCPSRMHRAQVKERPLTDSRLPAPRTAEVLVSALGRLT